mmetsp:Transcript_14946/g.37882  ORF Transcript_14946/g.37882 Transcript_14946/m.37882 type:complete len:126 (-) Transcript_14946:54-431(-)
MVVAGPGAVVGVVGAGGEGVGGAAVVAATVVVGATVVAAVVVVAAAVVVAAIVVLAAVVVVGAVVVVVAIEVGAAVVVGICSSCKAEIRFCPVFATQACSVREAATNRRAAKEAELADPTPSNSS